MERAIGPAGSLAARATRGTLAPLQAHSWPPLLVGLLLALVLAPAGCGGTDVPGAGEEEGSGVPSSVDTLAADTTGFDTLRAAAAARACANCEAALERCEAAAQDGAMLNACLGEFARCHVAATGLAVACPDEERCGVCLRETDDPDELVRISECILVVENVPEAARCRVAPDGPEGS